MSIKKMLDLSTAHLSKATTELLTMQEWDHADGILPVRWNSHEYGYIFFPTEPEDSKDWSAAPELEKINKYAYEHGCIVVNFDQDGEESRLFPSFDWTA